MTWTWTAFDDAVRTAGLQPIMRSGHHWQVCGGPLLVNVYPFTKRGPKAYVAGTTAGVPMKSIQDAIRMAKTAPKKYPAKRDGRRKNGYRADKKRLLRKSNRCRWCGCELTLKTATLEHIIPLARGGLDHHNNMALACESCNKKRGSDMPELSAKGRRP